MREASSELGADFFQLLTAMITNRRYLDVMDENSTYMMKSRLGEKRDDLKTSETRNYAGQYQKEIAEILDMIKRELLLIFKTNNYLRAIDRRLGNPHNTYNIINNVTWKVYCSEMVQTETTWQQVQEFCKYYFIKLMMTLYLWKLKVQGLVGIKASEEELMDFDLDYIQ